ncbi:MAG TPA: hypothetical protein VFK58_00510 [Sphingomicrobium sp.]|nr:hypothetical protein [Sphingomicrobium sp.]
MKPREERQKVMIRARMRTGASWQDVCILNLSKRGLGIQAATPPARGAYVEICRGSQVIVARVMWSKGHRAGLHSQDLIWAQALLCGGAAAANDPGPPAARPARADRRRQPRGAQQRHERSRTLGRAIELAGVAMAGAALGLAAFGLVQDALARPLSHIRSALG